MCKRRANRPLSFLSSFLPGLLLISSLAAKDYTGEVTSYFRSQFPDMRNTSLYVRETTLNLITKSRIYSVSSADIIPFRTWYLVISPNGRTLMLSYNKPSAFNRFIKNENLDLKTDLDHQNFIRLFLTLAANDETLLRVPPERSKIKDEFKNLDFSTKIKAQAGRKTMITFFSQNLSGPISRWRMKIKTTGEITNFDKTEISN